MLAKTIQREKKLLHSFERSMMMKRPTTLSVVIAGGIVFIAMGGIATGIACLLKRDGASYK